MTRRGRQALFFLLPMLILVVAFYILPLILTAWISFTPLTNWRVRDQLDDFVGLENYVNLYYLARYDPDFHKVLQTTLVFVTFTLFINVVGGLVLAILTYLID